MAFFFTYDSLHICIPNASQLFFFLSHQKWYINEEVIAREVKQLSFESVAHKKPLHFTLRNVKMSSICLNRS